MFHDCDLGLSRQNARARPSSWLARKNVSVSLLHRHAALAPGNVVEPFELIITDRLEVHCQNRLATRFTADFRSHTLVSDVGQKPSSIMEIRTACGADWSISDQTRHGTSNSMLRSHVAVQLFLCTKS